MAFEALYGLNTTLTAATAAGAGQLKIDNSEAASIAAQLGANFTYASLSDGVNFEIVRIDSVTAPFLNVTRAQDGTTTSAFPIGACLRFVWTAEGISATAAGVTFTVVGTGLATVTGVFPNFTVHVDEPNFTADLPIEVAGTYPDLVWSFQNSFGGCCCGGGGGGGGGTITEITGTGLVNITGGTGPTANIDVPVFNPIAGANMAITGTWPNFTFTATGGGGGGGVASVTGSTKILISGSLVNPVVNLIATGVGAGTFNGFTWDAWGCITAVNTSFVPVTTVAATAPITASIVGNTLNIGFSGSGGGIVTLVNNGNYVADSPSAYTTVIPSTAVSVPAMVAGQHLILTASATAYDTGTPGVVPTWGIAIFDGVTLLQGVKAIPTGTHIIKYTIDGAFFGSALSLSLRSTALTGTTVVVGASVVAEVFTI